MYATPIIAVLLAVWTTPKIDITLVGSPCIETIKLVVNGDDRNPYTIRQDDKEPCHYTKTLHDGAITIRKTIMSVRFGGGRSDCRIANSIPDPEIPHDVIGVLTFKFTPKKSVQPLSVTLPAPFTLEYGRHLAGNGGVSVECRESGFLEESGPIDDVDLQQELLTLQFRAAPGESNAESIAVDGAILTRIDKARPLTAQDIGEAYKRQAQVPRNAVENKRVLEEKLRKKGFTKALLSWSSR